MAAILPSEHGTGTPQRAEAAAGEASGAGEGLRQLWQVPFFLAGAAVLGVVALVRPFAGDPGMRQLQRDLTAVRQALTGPAEELQAAWRRAERALETVRRQPAHAGEAYFLAGSLQIRMAESAGSAEDADRHWQEARTYLAQAEQLGAPAADRGRLGYRLAKAGFHLGEDAEQVVEQLEAVADGADDPAEAYRLLIEAHLRLPSPNYEAALAVNEKLRMVPLLGEEVLAPTRLQAGEILIKLGRPEEARKVLEKVGPQSPTSVLARSRILQARSFQAERQWGEAASLWQAALADTREPLPEADRILFDLGVCYRNLDQPLEAARSWEQCLERGKGVEAAAAAVALAELHLQEGSTDKVLPALEKALASAARREGWDNPLVEQKRLLEVFERAAQTLRKADQYEQAVRLAELYQGVAPAGRAAQLKGESLAEWGKTHQETARASQEEEARKAEEQAARDLYRQASASFLTAADAAREADVQAGHLWEAARCLQEAGEMGQQVEVLRRFLKTAQQRDRLGEGWFLLAETLRKLDRPEAEEAYRTCILQAVSPYSYRARYQLAMASLKRGQLDEAEATLEQNLHLLRFDPDRESQEKSLFALGNLYFQRSDFRMVVRWLEEALGRFPTNSDATRARFQLAESYRQLAAQENQSFINGEYKDDKTRAHYQREHRRWLQKAADEFLSLARFLDTPESLGHLTVEERVQVPFTAAECRFNLGQYDEALQIYQHLAERYQGRLEALTALGGVVRCFAALGQAERLRQSLTDIRAALQNVDESIRQPWEEWLIIASKPLQKP